MTTHLTPAHVPSARGKPPPWARGQVPAGPGQPVGDSGGAAMRALTAAPGVSGLVRPDRVAAAPSRLPRLPWTTLAAAAPAPGPDENPIPPT